jgi:hypothetical protein|tara:strand:- start:190 stop:528 length:339 start_codon:yes stop_codon:yes gene_type:complete
MTSDTTLPFVTISQAMSCASAHGYTIKRDDHGEFEVAKRGNRNPDQVFYTPDIVDALLTMRYSSGFRDSHSTPGRAWRKMPSEIREASLTAPPVGRWANGYVDPIRTEESAS